VEIQDQTRGYLLSVIAAVSLVPAAILICGYFAVAGPMLSDVQATPGAAVRSISMELDRGRIRIWFEGPMAPRPAAALGRTIHWTFRLESPELKRCFWEFDNHALNLMPRMKTTAYIIAFPIWCALAPCLIAPLLWLRKQRRSRTQIGFPVEFIPRCKGASGPSHEI
jgi:hypothetical protein